jgi:hypothetical protein
MLRLRLNEVRISKVLNIKLKGKCPRRRLLLIWEQQVQEDITPNNVG